MKKTSFLLCCIVFVIVFGLGRTVYSQDELQASNTEQPEISLSDMKIFYLVMLNKGKNRKQSTEDTAAIQKGHLANITRLYEEGFIVMAGPMMESSDLRGIFIFDAESKEQVDSLCQTDPAIQAGRLDYTIHSWYTKAGTCLPALD